MTSRRSRSRREGELGFTLIELMVVMIVIGILAAIAIPVFINQRHKAYRTVVQADLSNVGKQVASYFVENNGSRPQVQILYQGAPYNSFHYMLAANPNTSGVWIDAGETSPNVWGNMTYGAGDPAAIFYFTSTTWTASAWCLSLYQTADPGSAYKYSAQRGLEKGNCSSPTAP